VTLLSSDLWYRLFRYDDTHHWYRSFNVLGGLNLFDEAQRP